MFSECVGVRIKTSLIRIRRNNLHSLTLDLVGVAKVVQMSGVGFVGDIDPETSTRDTKCVNHVVRVYREFLAPRQVSCASSVTYLNFTSCLFSVVVYLYSST